MANRQVNGKQHTIRYHVDDLMSSHVNPSVNDKFVMSADVPNAFIQTPMPERKDGEERVVMKITGVLVDLL